MHTGGNRHCERVAHERKNRFRRIFCFVARESRRAGTIPSKSLHRSVMAALSMATSAPFPMAIPTSASIHSRIFTGTLGSYA